MAISAVQGSGISPGGWRRNPHDQDEICIITLFVGPFTEFAMNHVSLDNQDESVKRFVLSLSADPGGSVLELNGQPVACVVPPLKMMNGSAREEEWTDAKNARRADLIKQKHARGLAPAEPPELSRLHNAML